MTPMATALVGDAHELVHSHRWRSGFLQTQALRELAALRWAECRGDEHGAHEWFRELRTTRAYDLEDSNQSVRRP